MTLSLCQLLPTPTATSYCLSLLDVEVPPAPCLTRYTALLVTSRATFLDASLTSSGGKVQALPLAPEPPLQPLPAFPASSPSRPLQPAFSEPSTRFPCSSLCWDAPHPLPSARSLGSAPPAGMGWQDTWQQPPPLACLCTCLLCTSWGASALCDQVIPATACLRGFPLLRVQTDPFTCLRSCRVWPCPCVALPHSSPSLPAILALLEVSLPWGQCTCCSLCLEWASLPLPPVSS